MVGFIHRFSAEDESWTGIRARHQEIPLEEWNSEVRRLKPYGDQVGMDPGFILRKT
jgi:hypothetical protein